ncbi:MAG: helix-turn-helix domain-containing protein [Polyangiales bacterium]
MRAEAIQAELRRIGLRLRSIRTERGFTQAEAAARSGLHTVQIARLEAGQRNVTISSLVALAQAFGVPLIELIAPREQPDAPPGA